MVCARLLALTTWALVAACAPDRAPVESVVVISIDTLRADRLGCYGYARPTSPFLDRLARDNVRCAQALSQAPWTLPGHAAMLASSYSSELGLGHFRDLRRIPERAVTLAEVLAQAGYRTHAVVAGGLVSGLLGFDQGFEVYDDARKRASRTVDEGLRFLARLGPHERFFLFLHTYDVHLYDPPAWARSELARPYDGALLGAEGLAKLVQSPEHADVRARLEDDDRRYLSDLYDASILSVDRELQRLFEGLEELGRTRNTLVVITSDHGEELFERGGSGHGYTLFEENLRVPLLLVHPALRSHVVADPVRVLDLAPTVLDLLELDPPASWRGTSLVPHLSGTERTLPAFAENAHRPFRSVRLGHLKYIEDFESGDASLFDLRADPHERHDLVGPAGTSHADAERLRRALVDWAAENAQRARSLPSTGLDPAPELSEQLDALGYTGGADAE